MQVRTVVYNLARKSRSCPFGDIR
ncbi:hypothetical protein LINGRAHAP2_LOCUS2797 [Linum grandiflorum]